MIQHNWMMVAGNCMIDEINIKTSDIEAERSGIPHSTI